LTIAALAARRRGLAEVVWIAENGQMAIHVPLTAARQGPFSTHTAHPQFVREVQEFFQAVLAFPIQIENPYVNLTKAEVIAKVVAEHPQAIPLSNSCWKSRHVHGHCGECIPCYVRRIALEMNGLPTEIYAKDLFNDEVGALPDTHEGKRNLGDLADFVYAFRTMESAELVFEYPALTNTFFDRGRAVAMYRRFAKEACTVWARYPHLHHLLPPAGEVLEDETA
jgi:hypothetical protein